MRKRIICLVLALAMVWTCTGALAAKYDGLWEKMLLQLELSGLKGSVTLSARGEGTAAALVNGLFRDATLEIRGIRSEGQMQYQAYLLRGEKQLGTTQLFSDGEDLVLSSELTPDTKVRLVGGEDLLEQLSPTPEGINPTWYSAALALLGLEETALNDAWGPALQPYEQALEIWIGDFAAAPEVIRDGNGETRMRLSYEIPAASAKAEAAALVRSMLADETLRALLAEIMTPAQLEAYLNPGWADYYARQIETLELGGTLSLEREMSLTGEELHTKLLFPLPVEQTGYDTLMIYREGDLLTVSLAGSEDMLLFDLTEKESGVSGVRLRGKVSRQPVSGEGGFEADFEWLWTTRESKDDDGREHEYKNLSVTLTPTEGEPVLLTAMIHLHGKSAQHNPTTLEISAELAQGEQGLTAAGTFKSTSPWVLQQFDASGAKKLEALGLDGLTALCGQWLAALTGLTESATPSDLPEPAAATATDLVPVE